MRGVKMDMFRVARNPCKSGVIEFALTCRIWSSCYEELRSCVSFVNVIVVGIILLDNLEVWVSILMF